MARIAALVEVGDALNGHVGVVHGGFTAGLLDDILGQTTIHEALVRGISGAPLTASLTATTTPTGSIRTPTMTMRCGRR